MMVVLGNLLRHTGTTPQVHCSVNHADHCSEKNHNNNNSVIFNMPWRLIMDIHIFWGLGHNPTWEWDFFKTVKCNIEVNIAILNGIRYGSAYWSWTICQCTVWMFFKTVKYTTMVNNVIVNDIRYGSAYWGWTICQFIVGIFLILISSQTHYLDQ